MNGLLEKDFCIILKRKKYLLTLLIVFVWTGFFVEQEFSLAYLPLIVTMFMLGTIGCDEADNGMAFLMTLPHSAKDYAKEKYLLGVILGGAATVINLIIQIAASVFKGTDLSIMSCVVSAVILIPGWTFLLAVTLPCELKFGVEKGRIVMFIVYGILIAVAIGARSILRNSGVNTDELLNSFSSIPDVVIVLALVVASLVILFISLLIAIKIMKTKEY